MRQVVLYEWQDMPKEMIIETDSDWAGDRIDRKSTSSGTIRWGSHLIRSWSKDQQVIALSSGEAELYAAGTGGANGLGVQSIAKSWGLELGVAIGIDSTAALGTAQRLGLGRMRHVEVKDLWLQEAVKAKRVRVYKVGTKDNTADMGTKPLQKDELRKHLEALKCYDPDDATWLYSPLES